MGLLKDLCERYGIERPENKRRVPKDGYDAWRESFHLEDNPYPKPTPEHSIWRDDYLFAEEVHH